MEGRYRTLLRGPTSSTGGGDRPAPMVLSPTTMGQYRHQVTSLLSAFREKYESSAVADAEHERRKAYRDHLNAVRGRRSGATEHHCVVPQPRSAEDSEEDLDDTLDEIEKKYHRARRSVYRKLGMTAPPSQKTQRTSASSRSQQEERFSEDTGLGLLAADGAYREVNISRQQSKRPAPGVADRGASDDEGESIDQLRSKFEKATDSIKQEILRMGTKVSEMQEQHRAIFSRQSDGQTVQDILNEYLPGLKPSGAEDPIFHSTESSSKPEVSFSKQAITPAKSQTDKASDESPSEASRAPRPPSRQRPPPEALDLDRRPKTAHPASTSTRPATASRQSSARSSSRPKSASAALESAKAMGKRRPASAQRSKSTKSSTAFPMPKKKKPKRKKKKPQSTQAAVPHVNSEESTQVRVSAAAEAPVHRAETLATPPSPPPVSNLHGNSDSIDNLMKMAYTVCDQLERRRRLFKHTRSTVQRSSRPSNEMKSRYPALNLSAKNGSGDILKRMEELYAKFSSDADLSGDVPNASNSWPKQPAVKAKGRRIAKQSDATVTVRRAVPSRGVRPSAKPGDDEDDQQLSPWRSGDAVVRGSKTAHSAAPVSWKQSLHEMEEMSQRLREVAGTAGVVTGDFANASISGSRIASDRHFVVAAPSTEDGEGEDDLDDADLAASGRIDSENGLLGLHMDVERASVSSVRGSEVPAISDLGDTDAVEMAIAAAAAEVPRPVSADSPYHIRVSFHGAQEEGRLSVKSEESMTIASEPLPTMVEDGGAARAWDSELVSNSSVRGSEPPNADDLLKDIAALEQSREASASSAPAAAEFEIPGVHGANDAVTGAGDVDAASNASVRGSDVPDLRSNASRSPTKALEPNLVPYSGDDDGDLVSNSSVRGSEVPYLSDIGSALDMHAVSDSGAMYEQDSNSSVRGSEGPHLSDIEGSSLTRRMLHDLNSTAASKSSGSRRATEESSDWGPRQLRRSLRQKAEQSYRKRNQVWEESST